MSHDSSLPNVLMLGTGEYTTGYTAKGASDSDKSTGVVALVMLDLQRRGKVGQKIGMCGTDGRKLPAVREHMQRVLGDVYAGIDPSGILTWPADDVVDRKAYLTALKAYSPGDVAIIFTPDDTHTELALACLAAGLHVLITKPPVKTLEEHIAIARAAKAADRLCVVEVHKRYDPIYADARDRVAGLGDFSYFTAHMSQPKHQLDTFAAWAGRSSDISYYLNSHHVDFHSWSMLDLARPEIVSALGSDGVADARLGIPMEDTITLAVRWRNCVRSARGEGTEAGSGGDDVTQRWFYMGHHGELTVDQAHRGYSIATDAAGFQSVNPLFWKPARNAITKEFAGQRTYGYLSFEAFVEAAARCNAHLATPADYDGALPTMATTAGATAILEAGRKSLDAGGRPFEMVYEGETAQVPTAIRAVEYGKG